MIWAAAICPLPQTETAPSSLTKRGLMAAAAEVAVRPEPPAQADRRRGATGPPDRTVGLMPLSAASGSRRSRRRGR